MKTRIAAFIGIVMMVFLVTGCDKSNTMKGLDGTEIALPEKIETIISAAPSNTQILSALGLTDKIIATDTYSVGIDGLKADLPTFDMMTPDAEQLLALAPDVLLLSGINTVGAEDPFKALKDAGTCVIYIPTSESLKGIEDSVTFIGDIFDKKAEAKAIVDDMENEIKTIKDLSSKINTKKKVYLEVSPAPDLYTIGGTTFLNEMVEAAGGINIFADQKGYLSITEEAILAANPDVIFTTVGYMEDPVGEIKSRAGWDVINAVKNGEVYQLPENETSQPTPKVIDALKVMAEKLGTK